MILARAAILTVTLAALTGGTWAISDSSLGYSADRSHHARLSHVRPKRVSYHSSRSVRSGSARSSGSRSYSGGGFSFGK